MFPDVHSVLKLDRRPSLAGQCVSVVEDEPLCGSFLIHHFLCQSLKGGGSVVFLGLEQSLAHYHAIGSKFGINLVKSKHSGQLVFLEGLKSIADAYSSSSNENQDFAFLSSKPEIGPTANDALRGLYLSVRRHATALSSSSHNGARVTVIIDKLSLLHTLGVPERPIKTFVIYLQQLCAELCLSLVLLCGADPNLAGLTEYLASSSSLAVHVWPLKTGKSEHVSGNMTFVWNDDSCESGRYQYKVNGEREVRVFALGASKSVL